MVIFGGILITYFYQQKEYQTANIYYYSSFEKNRVFKEEIKIPIRFNSDKKLTLMVNQILLGPKNPLEKGSQNKGVRCIRAFYFNQTVFVYLNQNFNLLTKNEIKQTLKSIAKTFDKLIKKENKFLKINLKNFYATENYDSSYFFNRKISFQKILETP